MSKIVRAVCNSNSFDDEFHRVSITSEGSFTNLLVDNLNGIYLRKNDEVYVFIEDDLINPMILGRCSGQLEIQDLLNLLNNFIDVFNKHVHKIPTGTFLTNVVVAGGSGAPATSVNTMNTGNEETMAPSGDAVGSIDPDDILYSYI